MSCSAPEFFIASAEDWPAIAPFASAFVAYFDGCYLPEDIRAEIERGEVMAWATVLDEQIVGATFFRVLEYPRKRVLEIFGLAGSDLARWDRQGMELVREYAENINAEIICAAVRPSLARFLRRRGWRQHRVLMRYD